MNFLVLIKVNLHKTINSLKSFLKDQRKREDLERRRELKHLKNYSRDIAEDEDLADLFDKRDKIIEDTKEE